MNFIPELQNAFAEIAAKNLHKESLAVENQLLLNDASVKVNHVVHEAATAGFTVSSVRTTPDFWMFTINGRSITIGHDELFKRLMPDYDLSDLNKVKQLRETSMETAIQSIIVEQVRAELKEIF
ncbi:hypothetical protein [Brevibacillus fortis]|uniref:hypothetical protein n=1 Tax=Brevibacillus fortis TaxID=2126352 RepID=UPI0038FC5A14